MTTAPATCHVVVMGVSGSGKTTVARGIAEATGLVFAEADEFHPAANVEKMRSGTPLTDDDRWPWLSELARWMAEQAAAGRSTIMACSALRRAYRDMLASGPPEVFFVHLSGDPSLIGARISGRTGHYMPASLLGSQLATLEPLEPDEGGLLIDIALPVPQIVATAVRAVEELRHGS